jgi:hypothetical protein
MSLTDAFLTTARDLLMMSENIKRMDSRIDKLVDENRSFDRRLLKIELMVDLARGQAPAEPHPRRRTPKNLPPTESRD